MQDYNFFSIIKNWHIKIKHLLQQSPCILQVVTPEKTKKLDLK